MKLERILVAVLIFLIMISGCESKKIASVPDHLIGLWGTSDSTYSDRTFEITRNEIIFQTGEKTFDTYTIKKIEMEKVPGEESSLYAISYTNKEGQKYKFSFYYYSKDDGVIRYKNQSQIAWTKEKK